MKKYLLVAFIALSSVSFGFAYQISNCLESGKSIEKCLEETKNADTKNEVKTQQQNSQDETGTSFKLK